jgi:hypothetical protein
MLVLGDAQDLGCRGLWWGELRKHDLGNGAARARALLATARRAVAAAVVIRLLDQPPDLVDRHLTRLRNKYQN